MAISFKSILGNWVGLTRPTTPGNGQALFSKRGFSGPYLYLHATEPTANSTSSIVDLEGFTTVTASATGTVAIGVRGITTVTSGASTTYTLAGPPGPGIRKTLTATSSSTSTRSILSAAQIIAGNAVGGDAGLTSGTTYYTVMTFKGAGNTIELLSLSTAAWVATNVHGFTTDATPLTTV